MNASLEALDPEIRGFVRGVIEATAQLSQGRELDWPRRRAIAEQVRAQWRQGGPAMADMCEWEQAVGSSAVRVRLYLPPTPAAALPLLVYLHGGGWSMFSIDSHDRLMREYAAAAGAAVLGVDYALAPEHRYPVALEQVVGIVRALPAQAAGFGIDAQRIALGGDSAGANLALAAALRLRDEGGPAMCGLLLNYGAYDLDIPPQDAAALGTADDMLPADEMRAFWDNYAGDGDRLRCDPLVAPLHAQLNGLPPSLLVAGERDVLCGQSLRMAERLRAHGGDAVLHRYSGMPHSFLEAMSVCRQSRRAIAESAAWLRERFAASHAP